MPKRKRTSFPWQTFIARILPFWIWTWSGMPFTHLARGLFCRKIPTLLISNTIDDAIAVELVQSGVSGVISRRTSPELLYKSLRAVVSGEIWVSRQIVAKLMGHMRMLPKSPPIAAETSPPTAIHLQSLKPLNRYGLTRRELQVVQAIGDAMTNKKIAHLLEMSECTVKHHLSKIFDKVGVHNRLELAMFAKNKGLVAHRALQLCVLWHNAK